MRKRNTGKVSMSTSGDCEFGDALDEIIDVVAGAKIRAGTGDDHAPYRVVGRRPIERFGHLGIHGAGQGVLFGRAVEPQAQHTLAGFTDNLAHGRVLPGVSARWYWLTQVQDVRNGDAAASLMIS